MTVATLAYPVGEPRAWDEFESKVRELARRAHERGAKFWVLPEYFSMELAALFDRPVRASLSRQLEAVQGVLPEFRKLFADLARTHEATLVAGTFPVAVRPGEFRNRSYVYHPDGSEDFQDKLLMTRFENELWKVSPGDALRVFRAEWGAFGVSICYESEFPLPVRRQAEAGALLLAVPSCTDSRAGDNRVRIGCRARAMENQFFVARSPLVGRAEWSPAIDENTGAASVYTPVDRKFPDDGVAATGGDEEPGWVFADLDLDRVEWIRQRGMVFNYADWPKQAHAVAD